tara:strand:+ start:243 stop:449 length:207 start_codon:yes stop_codon:yes gene_type:complete
MEYEMINNISYVTSVKVKNIAIAKEMNKILRLKRVITKPARRRELDSLFNQCLETFITINNKGVRNEK